MPELSKKLERFTSILLAEATEETQRTLDALKQKHDAALSAAEDQVLQEAYDYIHAEVSRIRSEQGQKVSQRLMENKRALSRRREEIAQEVFAQVRARIGAFTETPAYAQRLAALLREALAALQGARDVVVTLREEDLPLADTLRSAVPAAFPVQAGPTIIEDNCFIGARSEIVEGVVVEENSVISMGVFIGQSTKIYDRDTGEIFRGRVPAGSVVVPGSLPSKDGKYNLNCAVIVKRVDARTRSKTSVNELLRD